MRKQSSIGTCVSILLLMILILICCSGHDNTIGNDAFNIEFEGNASIDEINDELRYLVSEYDFCVIFYYRGDVDWDWYKLFAKRGNNWEKIEVKESIFDEERLRSDPDYYIARDITTKQLCKPEEANFFLAELKRYKLFELPEEDIIFRGCKNTQIADLGSTFIQMVSGSKVRSLRYSGIYQCEGNEWNDIRRIDQLFEDEWIPGSLIRVGLYNKMEFR